MDYSKLKVPNHVAIILDGNGRWAKERGLSRSKGHDAGFENLKKMAKYVFSKGISVLSVYAFSTENFKREKAEVDFLMNLFFSVFNKEFDFIMDNKIRVVFSGRREPLSDKVLKTMDKIMEDTKDFDGLTFNICLNYGSVYEMDNLTFPDTFENIDYNIFKLIEII